MTRYVGIGVRTRHELLITKRSAAPDARLTTLTVYQHILHNVVYPNVTQTKNRVLCSSTEVLRRGSPGKEKKVVST